MARLRSPAQRSPQTKEQALALATDFATAAARYAEAQANRQALHARVDAAADAITVPLDAVMKNLVKQLKPWFAANVDQLTEGKRKSIKLGGCLIGYRINPPKVAFDGKDDGAVQVLLDAGLTSLVRVKNSPDKEALLKLLEGEDAGSVTELGFSIEQKEVFFIDALEPEAAGGTAVDAEASAVV